MHPFIPECILHPIVTLTPHPLSQVQWVWLNDLGWAEGESVDSLNDSGALHYFFKKLTEDKFEVHENTLKTGIKTPLFDLFEALVTLCDINHPDIEGRRLLHKTSAIYTHLLLQLGANPNVVDHEGNTPLKEAIGQRDVAKMLLLLDAGASFENAIKWALEESTTSTLKEALEWWEVQQEAKHLSKILPTSHHSQDFHTIEDRL